MQLAQPAQERMKGGLQRRAGIALAWLLVVAALQVGTGAERASGACDDEAAHLGAPVVDLIQRLGEAAQHVDGDRVHDLLVVERENRDRSVEIERDVLELHCFLASGGPAL
jgi:hypothetical protein